MMKLELFTQARMSQGWEGGLAPALFVPFSLRFLCALCVFGGEAFYGCPNLALYSGETMKERTISAST